jgi:hypothetical protein
MSFIPEECFGFHKNWLECGHSEETIDDLETIDIVKALISLHCELAYSNDDEFLLILDRLNRKKKNAAEPHRIQQINLAKDLVKSNQLSIVDAIFLLFSRDELINNS